MLVYVTLHTNPHTYAYTVTVVILTNVFSQILCVMKVCIITGNELTMNSSQFMYMIVHICIHIYCIHVYMHMYLHAYIHICMCTYICTYIRLIRRYCMYLYMCVM